MDEYQPSEKRDYPWNKSNGKGIAKQNADVVRLCAWAFEDANPSMIMNLIIKNLEVWYFTKIG